MAIVAVVLGTFLAVIGGLSTLRAEPPPPSPAAHWLSFPGGRRVGGMLTVLLGLALLIGSTNL